MTHASRLLFRFGALAATFALAGCECGDPLIAQKPQVDQIDVYEQKAASQVDILWVIDNSDSMVSEQNKVAGRFSEFFNQLLTSQVDYHIGVITTDPADSGILRSYQGPTATGCVGCRFVTKDVPCANATVDISDLTSESEIEARLSDQCQAQLVFRNLIRVGTGGTAFEQGFATAAQALGVKDVDIVTGLPANNPPTENAGFLRRDASLYIVFVSDEDEGSKADGSPIGYYRRLFESLKGAGNENKVSIAAITGYPIGDANLPTLDQVCGVLANPNDARLAAVRDAFVGFETGCIDEEAQPSDPSAHAETGGRFIQLACLTGGVVANMCQADYTTALDALGANAAGLLRKFALSNYPGMERGQDCTLFTEDDFIVDCDGNGNTDDALDGPLCVTARGIGEEQAHLVQKSDTTGWRFEDNTKSIRFDGGFVPAPGSNIEIRYLVSRKAKC